MTKIAIIFICVCVLVGCLVGCIDSATAEETVNLEETPRFYVVSEAFDIGNTYHSGVILVDRETNVCYLCISGANRAGITVMLDAEGKPLLWEDKT